MKWSYRRYRLWVINTSNDAKLFLFHNWKLFIPSIDNLLQLTSEAAFIRSFQSYEFENRWLGFGRMSWNDTNNLKWTTKYREDERSEKKLNFQGTEIWAPDWNKVSDRGVPPDVFISLYYYPTLEKIREGLVIAIPTTIYRRNMGFVDAEIAKFGSYIPNSSISTLTRFWQPFGKFVNNLEDMNPHELQKIVEGKI